MGVPDPKRATGTCGTSWPGVLLAGVGALALLWHHAYPRTVVAVTAAASNAAGALGYPITPCCWHRSWPRSTGWPSTPTAGPRASA
jgi:hypothetical protein